MHYIFLFLMSTMLSNPCFSLGPGQNIFLSKKLSSTLIQALKKNKIYSSAVVNDSVGPNFQKQQELNFQIAGLHSKGCHHVLRKLSLYENYSLYLDFVKKSSYDEKRKRINFLLSSDLLPISMRLDFKIPRIKNIGTYPFQFDKGFLSGLSGLIEVSEIENRCFFYTKAYWEGPHTHYPNFVFEFFSSTLSKLAMENLFRISQNL